MYRLFGKRVLDMLIIFVSFVFLLPLLLLTACMIKIFDPGPIIFQQRRMGVNGQAFTFYKFRSMPTNTGDISSDQLGSIKLTWVGKLIRRSNIDELPQLYNVFKGDMSLVGPRPPIASQTELIDLRKKNGAIACRPGLTGLAQVRSFDGMTVSEKAAFDGAYATNITLLSDVKIILETFTYLLKPPPVY
jgi:O-antigen biosynthesis protein WbqP